MNHYADLRDALARRLPDGLILVSGGTMIARNHDVDFVFRQRSDFLYLTGVEEPGAFLMIDPKRRQHTLFIPRVDSHHKVWLGHVPTAAESRKLFGFARVMYHDELAGAVKKASQGYKLAYADEAAYKAVKTALKLPNKAAALHDALEELRIVKTDAELELMKRANEVSGAAHVEVMRRARPGMFEYEVQAVFEAECLRSGLRHLAYPSIVAGGKNGAVLHYHRNNARVEDGDFLLIDAGAELSGYAADITRTFPVNGRFTQRQKDVYEIVLDTQKKIIDAARPGANSADLHVQSMRHIAQGLKDLGILIGEPSGHVEGGAVRLFYPHGIGHTLGLDVHDTLGGRKRKLPNPTKVPVRFIANLEPGFVITVEPGIYFIEALLRDPELRRKHKGSIDFAKAEQFLDLGGVRIEDDVVVEPSGPPLNLTSVPKEVRDVEEVCAQGRQALREPARA